MHEAPDEAEYRGANKYGPSVVLCRETRRRREVVRVGADIVGIHVCNESAKQNGLHPTKRNKTGANGEYVSRFRFDVNELSLTNI